MDVFKVFEATVPELKSDYTDAKDLRRDQLLDNYDAAVKALQCLIKAKENELAYRRALVEMLEQSKTYYDKQQANSSVTLDSVKKYTPEKSITPLSNQSTTPISSGTTPAAPTTPTTGVSSQSGDHRSSASNYQSAVAKNHDHLDIPMQQPTDRTSLDNRLSEFLKTYPILSQAGLAAPTNTTDTSVIQHSNNVRPSPGYYTQQPPPPPPPASMTAAPPLMAMLRFPPPPMIPPNQQLSNLNLASSQENHETADMDLSDHDEPAAKIGIIPMVASAMQQGAGGKQGLGPNEQPSYGASGYNNLVQYTSTSRMGTLPFDPSIMDPTFSSPMSSGSSSRDKHPHTDRGSHRHSSSGSSGSKHGSDKSSKYSSSSQSSKNKRR